MKGLKLGLKLTVKTPEQRQGRHSSVNTVNFEQTIHIILVLFRTVLLQNVFMRRAQGSCKHLR